MFGHWLAKHSSYVVRKDILYVRKAKLQAFECQPSHISKCSTLRFFFFFFSRRHSICERVTPRLSHANSAVVLSAVKVLMKFLELLPKDSDYYNTLLKKLSPPLVTLLSGEPEVQYVALRNINLIVQKRSEQHHYSLVHTRAPQGSECHVICHVPAPLYESKTLTNSINTTRWQYYSTTHLFVLLRWLIAWNSISFQSIISHCP